MVNNFININKKNNDLSPQLIEHKKDHMTNDVGKPDPDLGQVQKCDGVKPVKTVNGITNLL